MVIRGESGREKTQPDQKEPDHSLTTDKEGFRKRGEGETGESQDERRPNPTREPDPHHHTRQRGIQRGR